MCHESIKTELITALKQQILVQFGVVPLANNSYGKIINKKHFDRICSLIDPSKIVCGGKSDAAILKIEPTIMDNISWKDPVMTQEIFGPVLPVLTYSTEEELLHILNSRARPLALYLFTTNQALEQKILSRCSFGGGCVNDTIVHLATNNMGFGGVGESGMGAYHGKVGFDTFSHTKTIVNKKTWIDVKMRYQPYTAQKARALRKFLK